MPRPEGQAPDDRAANISTGARRRHARSASHGAWSSYNNRPSFVPDVASGDIPQNSAADGPQHPYAGETSAYFPYLAGEGGLHGQDYWLPAHQRTLSHGQTVEGVTGQPQRAQGHRRDGSRTDFILPSGHEKREKLREKISTGRKSSFPFGHKRNTSKTESIYTIRDSSVSLLRRLTFWKKKTESTARRTVVPNHVLPLHVPSPNSIFPTNRITTTKYTLINFIPKNLFEQFHRLANLYFLFIVLLNFVPSINAFAKEVAMLPLLFVLCVTAVKDAFEDRRRYKSDQRVNSTSCRVYSSDAGRYLPRRWEELRVGDVVHLSCNETVPADLLLLHSSDSHGLCYLESSNLDGESNLKQRQAVRGLGMDNNFDVSKLDSLVEISAPSTKIYHFIGTIPLQNRTIPLDENNLLLRSCTIKNTDFIEGLVLYAGHETKVMLNSSGARHKRSRLERVINSAVVYCVAFLLLMCLVSATGTGIYQYFYEEALTKGFVVPFLPPARFLFDVSSDGNLLESVLGRTMIDPPAIMSFYSSPGWVAFLAFWTFIVIYQVIIPIALYVTVEIIKLLQVYHIHNDPEFVNPDKGTTIECRAMNITEDLGQVQHIFTDKTGTLTENNMVFLRCSVNGVDYQHEIAPPIDDKEAVKANCRGKDRNAFLLNKKLQEDVRKAGAIAGSFIKLQSCKKSEGAVPESYLSHQLTSVLSQRTEGPSVSLTRKEQHNHQRLLDFFLTVSLCNSVIVTKMPHKDQMTASGIIVPPPSQPPTPSTSSPRNFLLSSLPSLPSFPNLPSLPTLRLPPLLPPLPERPRISLRSLNPFTRPLSPIASSPTASPELLRQNTIHDKPSNFPISEDDEESSVVDSEPYHDNIIPSNDACSKTDLEMFRLNVAETQDRFIGSPSASMSSNADKSDHDNKLGFQTAHCNSSDSVAGDATTNAQSVNCSFNCQSSHFDGLSSNPSDLASSIPLPDGSRTIEPPATLSLTTHSSNSGQHFIQADSNSALTSCLSDSSSSPLFLHNDSTTVPFEPIFEAESPDELALVDAAYRYGVRLLHRSIHSELVDVPGCGILEFEVLHVFPFDSTRKRMSVMVRHPLTGQIMLYCKGADSAILDILAHPHCDEEQLRQFRAQQHLYQYSKLGLRTLCMAARPVPDSEYVTWSMSHAQALAAHTDREYKLQSSYRCMETNLVLLGATGIEDKLQPDVPETLEALRAAGIAVWLLTGDKQETAINVAYSAALFSSDMKVLKLNAYTREQAERTLQMLLESTKCVQAEETADAESVLTVSTAATTATLYKNEILETSTNDARSTTGPTSLLPTDTVETSSRSCSRLACPTDDEEGEGQNRERGLVVDGKTLLFILDRRTQLLESFLTLAQRCRTVLISRATPLQKALVVRLTKQALNVVCLAVGDGANDVSMIQTADVGVGISGVEGRQAVMASDFAISTFSHIHRLLLVHGHWSYQRLASIILYYFYKNANVVLILMWYQLYCCFSGNNFIDQMYLLQFSLTFTSLPPIVVGVYDQDAPSKILMSEPNLYKQGRVSAVYRNSYFWVNILDAIYQSIILFFFAVGAHYGLESGLDEVGITIVHSCLVAQLLHISIETKSWTVLHIGSLALSLFIFYAFGALYTMTCVVCFGLHSLYWVWPYLLASPRHWFIVLLSVVTALLPRFVYRALQSSLWPTDVQLSVLRQRHAARLRHKQRIEPSSNVRLS